MKFLFSRSIGHTINEPGGGNLGQGVSAKLSRRKNHYETFFSYLAIIGFAGILAACGGDPGQTTQEIGDPERGREVFTNTTYTQCEGCHSLDGSEFRGAPSMLGISEQAGERVAGLSDVEYLRQSILEPSAYIVEGYEKEMKPYELVERAEGDYKAPGTLTEEELNDLISFLLTQ